MIVCSIYKYLLLRVSQNIYEWQILSNSSSTTWIIIKKKHYHRFNVSTQWGTNLPSSPNTIKKNNNLIQYFHNSVHCLPCTPLLPLDNTRQSSDKGTRLLLPHLSLVRGSTWRPTDTCEMLYRDDRCIVLDCTIFFYKHELSWSGLTLHEGNHTPHLTPIQPPQHHHFYHQHNTTTTKQPHKRENKH